MTARAAIAVAAAAVGRSVGSAVRGVNAHRGMGGPIASAGAVREMNPKLHRVVPEVVCFYLNLFYCHVQNVVYST